MEAALCNRTLCCLMESIGVQIDGPLSAAAALSFRCFDENVGAISAEDADTDICHHHGASEATPLSGKLLLPQVAEFLRRQQRNSRRVLLFIPERLKCGAETAPLFFCYVSFQKKQKKNKTVGSGRGSGLRGRRILFMSNLKVAKHLFSLLPFREKQENKLLFFRIHIWMWRIHSEGDRIGGGEALRMEEKDFKVP